MLGTLWILNNIYNFSHYIKFAGTILSSLINETVLPYNLKLSIAAATCCADAQIFIIDLEIPSVFHFQHVNVPQETQPQRELSFLIVLSPNSPFPCTASLMNGTTNHPARSPGSILGLSCYLHLHIPYMDRCDQFLFVNVSLYHHCFTQSLAFSLFLYFSHTSSIFLSEFHCHQGALPKNTSTFLGYKLLWLPMTYRMRSKFLMVMY